MVERDLRVPPKVGNDRQRLASPAFKPDPKAFMSHAINNVLAHIRRTKTRARVAAACLATLVSASETM